jgi:7,8-dihydro-6-hydroxymethylpterin dimethyltransferase
MRKPLPIVVDARSDQVVESLDKRLEGVAARLRALDYAQVRDQFSVPADARLLKTTLSLCPQCLAHIPAAVYAQAGKVLLNKQCSQHGFSRATLENDERYYYLSNKDRWGRRYAPDRVMDIPAFDKGGCCGPGQSCGSGSSDDWTKDFSDQRGNKSCTVLVEVTDACNLACRVCYADSKGDRLLPLADFRNYLHDLIAQKGRLDSVQVTGGEASLHPQFWDMLDFLHAEPNVGKIYLPTNGIEFVKPGMAERLVAYRDKLLVLLQFDGADAATNRALRQANPQRVRERLLTLLDKLDVPMQLTMTLARGVSEREIAWVVAQGRRHRNVRLVAMQPATYSGRYELEPDPIDRMTLSDVVKGVVAGLGGRTQETDFLPIPCSHPNCGWVTLFARRLGLFVNIARQVDLNAVMDQVAYKTLLTEREMQDIIGTRKGGFLKRLAARLGRRLVRPRDVFGIAIKPFMDRFSYDQDRVSACCHHILDTQGGLVSFCEYNARIRPQDSWSHFPRLEGHAVAQPATG